MEELIVSFLLNSRHIKTRCTEIKRLLTRKTISFINLFKRKRRKGKCRSGCLPIYTYLKIICLESEREIFSRREIFIVKRLIFWSFVCFGLLLVTIIRLDTGMVSN